MQVNSAVNSAMFGYQKASENLTSSAQNIATVTANSGMSMTATDEITNAASVINDVSTINNVDLNTELLNMNTALYNGMASLKVLDTADEILGTTIDVSI